MADLSNTIEWLHKINTTMLQHFGIKCILYVIENSYSEVEKNVFK